MSKVGNFIQGCMHYNRIMLFMVLLIAGIGVAAIWVIPKQEFPVFTVRQGVIVAVYPGATAQQVEEQVAKPLEEFMFTYKEIKRKKTYTTSQDGMVIMRVELNDEVNNKDEVWSKIKHGLAGFKSSLPSGVLALVAQDDFGDTSALLVTIQSNDKTPRELENYLTELEGRLRRLDKVSNLRRYGVQKEQLSIYLDKDKLQGYGITPSALMMQLNTESNALGGATAENDLAEVPIHVDANYSNEYEVEQQIIGHDADGGVIRLKDVAQVVREYPKPDSYVNNNGKTAVVLSMEARTGENIVQFGREVDEVINEFKQELPPSVEIERIADQPKVVDNFVTSFLRDLFVSIFVVIAVMLILFSWRSALVAALSIPLSVFISIAIMNFMGIELNTATLAVLIVVLGMIVDNSVIVIDAYVQNLDDGMTRPMAAMRGAKDYFWSILLATVCLCSLFFPTLFVLKGQFRDFVNDFPTTFTIAMLVSLALAMVFIPYVAHKVIKKGNRQTAAEKPKKINLFVGLQNLYEKALRSTFKHPWITIGVTILVVLGGAAILATIPQRMMPFVDRDQFAVEIYLPAGTSLDRTKAVTDSVSAILQKDKRIKSATSFIGTGAPRFQISYAPNPASKHYSQIIVNTVSNDATNEVLDDYANSLAHYWPEAYVKFKQLDYSVVAAPIEIRLRGNDLTQLKHWADTTMNVLRTIPGLTRIHTDFEETQPILNVDLDPVKASQAGISRTAASAQLAMSYSGLPAGQVWEGDYPLNLVLKSRDDRVGDDLSEVEDQFITTPLGQKIPLRQIARVNPDWEQSSIVRRNGVRTISILADVMRGASESSLIKEVNSKFDTQVVPKLPSTVKYEIGGTYENNNESSGDIMISVGISFFIVFMFLLLNFKKLSLTIVSLLSIILCLPGVVMGLIFFGKDFSLTVFLGIVALMGISMRNVIIMYQHAEDKHNKEGYSAKDAAYDAGRRRMVPIFLTSATTAVGIIPMIIADSPLWSPMAAVILCGTIVSLLMIVLVLPVVYWKITASGDKKRIPSISTTQS